MGNKLDMNDKRQVSIQEGEDMAKEKDLLFKEVSAKSGINVNNLFYKDIFEQIARKYNLGGMGEVEDNSNNVKELSKSIIFLSFFLFFLFR